MHILFSFVIFVFFAFFAGISDASFSFASKGRTTGPSIHTTYFLTPNNAGLDINAKAYMGKWINGNCVYNDIYDMGSEYLQTGDFVDFDSLKLKAIVGTTYNCMSVYYTYKQLVIETFLLMNDGRYYVGSFPPTSEVNIL